MAHRRQEPPKKSAPAMVRGAKRKTPKTKALPRKPSPIVEAMTGVAY